MNTQTLDSLKENLIVRIKNLGDEKSLRKVAKTVESVEKRPTEKQLETLKRLAKPMRKKTDIEELIKEQGWKPSTNEEIEEIVKGFNWEISDEDFIKELKSI